MSAKIYNLQIEDGLCTLLDSNRPVRNQLKKVRLKRAIYVFRRDQEIIYVGETRRGVYRCIDGLMCPESQSVAYPWRNHRDIRNSQLQLMVTSVGLPATMARKKSSREVVEADVASAIFAAKRSWPSKLSAIKVHGGINRTQSYQHATQGVLKALKDYGWL